MQLDNYEKEAEYVLKIVDIATAIKANNDYKSDNYYTRGLFERTRSNLIGGEAIC